MMKNGATADYADDSDVTRPAEDFQPLMDTNKHEFGTTSLVSIRVHLWFKPLLAMDPVRSPQLIYFSTVTFVLTELAIKHWSCAM
jgi:hypothetical protein